MLHYTWGSEHSYCAQKNVILGNLLRVMHYCMASVPRSTALAAQWQEFDLLPKVPSMHRPQQRLSPPLVSAALESNLSWGMNMCLHVNITRMVSLDWKRNERVLQHCPNAGRSGRIQNSSVTSSNRKPWESNHLIYVKNRFSSSTGFSNVQ